MGAGHDRVGAAAVAAGGLTVAHISTVNRSSTLLKGAAVDPQKEQRSAIHMRNASRIALVGRRSAATDH